MHYNNNCINCGRTIRNMRDTKSCTSCKKLIHSSCELPPGSSDNLFTCSVCREKSLVDGDADDAVMPCVATERAQRQRTCLYLTGVDEEADEDDEDEIEYGTAEPPSSSSASLRRHATRNSHRISPMPSKLTDTSGRIAEVFACSSAGSRSDAHNISPAGELMSSSGALLDDDPFLGSSPISVRIHSSSAEFLSISSQRSGSADDGSSIHDNSSPTKSAIGHMSEEPVSDSDEYKPPCTKKDSSLSSGTLSRGGRTAKKKPTGNSRQSTSMRTRSGGKPPVNFYSRIGYIEESERSNETISERARRTRAAKGKGNGAGGGRGRSRGGRGSKYINPLSSSRREMESESRAPDTAPITPTPATIISTDISSQQASSARKTVGAYNATAGPAPCPTTSTTVNTDENDYIRTAVVTNAADKFMNSCSMCIVCGSSGKNVEGTMITCASCAQTFHTFCVGVHEKLNSTVLKRGWRCLDCTVCEGCGSGNDEPNLLLCDECDVSFHTYCLDPKLEQIPTGSWRCKWCAMCCRCGKKIQSSLDLQRFEGLCEACYSLRKCMKCMKLYESGDLLIKCQRCVRWFHARCEHITTEEQAENAAENAFRCSFCRPQSSASYNDVINTSVIVDNVMIDKTSADYIQSIQNVRRSYTVLNGSSIHETMATVIRNPSCDIDDFDTDDVDPIAYAGAPYSGRGRGGCGRGGGPGRRPPKIGVGGFNVKMPRHRFLAIIADEQQQSQVDGGTDDDGKMGKVRRTRKSRKPQLESAYPAEIQLEFFGFGAVDSRSLAEVLIDEPVLGEFKKPLIDVSAFTRNGAELSEPSAEALRNEQEQDMLGDIFPGVELPMELDFDDIMIGADDDDEMDDNPRFEESLTDGFSATESTGIITGMCSPSTSAIGMGESHFGLEGDSSSNTPNTYANAGNSVLAMQQQQHFQMQQDDQRKRQQQLQNRLGMNGGNAAVAAAVLGTGLVQRSNSQHSELGTVEKPSQVNQATERWEEDEPLGDKATKAAVLYANLCHPHLKTKFPLWAERVKQITREWRALDAEKRQVYVDMARKNRANSGMNTRRRTRRPNASQNGILMPDGTIAAVPFERGPPQPVVTAMAAAPPPSSNAEMPAQSTGSRTDVVNAQVSAIKQANLRAILQQQQRKELDGAESDDKPFSTKTESELLFINGRPPKSEAVMGNGVLNQTPKNNCVDDSQKSTQTVQFVVTSMLKQQQQQQQLQNQRQHVKTVLSPELTERHSQMKQGLFEAEKTLQTYENEISRLQKQKNKLSAKRRQLLRAQKTESEINDAQQQQEIAFQKMEVDMTQQSIDQSRRELDMFIKRVNRCKSEIQEMYTCLHEFEVRHGILGSQNLGENTITNGSLASLEEGKIGPAMQPHLPNQHLSQMTIPQSVNAMIRPTGHVSSAAPFIVRQQSAPQPSANIIQQMSSQFASNNVSSIPPSTAPVTSHIPPHGGGRFVQQTAHRDVLSVASAGSNASRGLDSVESHTLASTSTQSSTLMCGESASLPKSGRGRKRKKPLEDVRSSVLGGVLFVSLQSQLEKDVYDVMDSLLNAVNAQDKRPDTTSTSIKRILYAQSVVASTSDGASPVGAIVPSNVVSFEEPPRAKKKRQQFKRQATNDPNEFEATLARVQSQMESFQFPKRSLEQYYEFDATITYYPYMTNLPDRPGKLFIFGHNIAEYTFPFMTEYYGRIESGEGLDEDRFYPKAMVDIYSGVNMNALLAYDDENLNDLMADTKPGAIRFDDNFLYHESYPRCLSLDNMGDRAKIHSSCALLGPTYIERQPPLEPYRSLFYAEVPPEENVKLELVLEVESTAEVTERMEMLRNLLGLKNAIDFHIETPPESPPLDDVELTEVHSVRPNREIKTEPNEEVATPQTISVPPASSNRELFVEDPLAKRCRNCELSIFTTTNPIEEVASRLGLTPPDEKSEKVSFCSMKCYYKFMVTCKVPLSMELLDRAEKYVDEETMEKLRQISTESFVKKLQQHTTDSRMDIKTSFLSPAVSFASPLGTEAVTELMRVPREHLIRACDLPTLVQNMEEQNKARNIKGEYKWRGHSWMICDLALLQSFHRPHDDRSVSLHFEIHEKSRASRADDTRFCALCAEHGDGDKDVTGRLLNVDANEWVHVNCALWSSEVHEAESGALLNVEAAIRRAKSVNCVICNKAGASLKCYKLECAHGTYHLPCAQSHGGKFVRDKTFVCPHHEVRPEMRVFRLEALRRIYIHRDENQLLSKIFNHSYPTEMMMRVGSLIFHKIGQLLPEQLKSFHNENHIFPIGYRVTRIFWSPTNPRERMRYQCWIEDRGNQPEFCVAFEAREFRDFTPSGAWSRILLSIPQAREKAGNMLKFFPNQINGETLFGFFEPAITKMIESLPGVDQLYTYTFKHGGSPLMDLPLAVNPSGCARSEPCFRTLIKRRYRPLISGTSPKKPLLMPANNFSAEVIPREARSTRSRSTRFQSATMPSRLDPSVLKAMRASGISEEMLSSPYFRTDASNNSSGQEFSLYRRMQKEWPNNVYLARSKIQGLGLYAKRDIDMNAMIIEYKGEVIRSEVGETREKRYMAQNRGVYMFRVDDEMIIDATMAGGLARYINHSCDPNCSTRILQYNEEKKIIITANRPIKAGEELTYDYQFELEDTTEKLPCLCGAPNCNKWMN